MAKTISITDQGVQLTNSEDSELNLFGMTLSSDYMTVPSGNTLQRPDPAEAGMIRLNTDIAKLEGYDGTNWANIGSGVESETPEPISSDVEVQYLVIAGGGSSGVMSGGGAGGLLSNNFIANANTSYSVTVGGGAASGGSQGSNSSIFGFISVGGGRGVTFNTAGGPGGSGGGAGYPFPGEVGINGGTSVAGQGNRGGNTTQPFGQPYGACGGGGAGAAGLDLGPASPRGYQSGPGGNGLPFSWVPESYGTPGPTPGRWFAGGGAGSWGGSSPSPYAVGGAGGGGSDGPASPVGIGKVNTGGGGAKVRDLAPGAGGSGVIILKYPDSYTLSNPGGGLTMDTDTANVVGYIITAITAGTGNIEWN